MHYKEKLRLAREAAFRLRSELGDHGDSESLRSRIISEQNIARGLLGEFAAFWYLIAYRHVESGEEIIEDRRVFDTPFGQRRVDVFDQVGGLAIEAKSGYLYDSKGTRTQVVKDSYLLSQGLITECVWLLLHGGSAKALKRLNDHGIQYLVGWFGSLPLEFLRESEFGLLPKDGIHASPNWSGDVSQVMDPQLTSVMEIISAYWKDLKQRRAPNIVDVGSKAEAKRAVLHWDTLVKPLLSSSALELRRAISKWVQHLNQDGYTNDILERIPISEVFPPD